MKQGTGSERQLGLSRRLPLSLGACPLFHPATKVAAVDAAFMDSI